MSVQATKFFRLEGVRVKVQDYFPEGAIIMIYGSHDWRCNSFDDAIKKLKQHAIENGFTLTEGW